MNSLTSHFSAAEICEIGYVVLAYSGAQKFLTTIDLRVYDDGGNDLTEEEGYPLVSTLTCELTLRDL